MTYRHVAAMDLDSGKVKHYWNSLGLFNFSSPILISISPSFREEIWLSF